MTEQGRTACDLNRRNVGGRDDETTQQRHRDVIRRSAPRRRPRITRCSDGNHNCLAQQSAQRGFDFGRGQCGLLAQLIGGQTFSPGSRKRAQDQSGGSRGPRDRSRCWFGCRVWSRSSAHRVVPDPVEIDRPVAKQAGLGHDMVDVGPTKAARRRRVVLEKLQVVARHQRVTQKLDQVRLAVRQRHDVFDGIGVVVDAEIGRRRGDQTARRGR